MEVIRQAVRRGRKVLACAPSNLAVDNIFERLLGFGERAVRLGHPARVLPELREHTLDLLVEKHHDVRLARKLVKQAMVLFREAGPAHPRRRRSPARGGSFARTPSRCWPTPGGWRSQAVDSILDSASVLCATTTGLDSQILGAAAFRSGRDRRGLPEHRAGLLDPAVALRPRGAGRRPLPVAAHDRQPRGGGRRGFGVSLFERLMGLYGPQIARRLTVQYRMHAAIMELFVARVLRRRAGGRPVRRAGTCWATCPA